ncbi:oxaloacetate decarboxylase gamma subunit [Parabacteroides sp. PFB2-12]|uniref:OadG family protein n=1 Tax=unclassified Parabacteroides TaxID=2649774 RepID=UPI0024732028|nr:MULTISPECIES: OadG family protein [unclassified Parabacteroides]MDH6343287.1 oxaloacetate decarboxylase gamma subunit [Parabacteroides sp. PM6-13]MDH6390303.1 oxaloacetate decarboxylase gamma subunit [Parabacteroides sp. PFB2-12]
MENMQTGLLLMVVGTATVFLILLIVIYLGKGLIVLVNRYAPEEVVIKKQAPVRAATTATGGLSNQETAAIVSAVSAATGGQGKVTKIEKI